MCRPPQSHVIEIRAKRYKTSGISRHHKRKRVFELENAPESYTYTKLFLAPSWIYPLCPSPHFERTTLEIPFLGIPEKRREHCWVYIPSVLSLPSEETCSSPRLQPAGRFRKHGRCSHTSIPGKARYINLLTSALIRKWQAAACFQNHSSLV